MRQQILVILGIDTNIQHTEQYIVYTEPYVEHTVRSRKSYQLQKKYEVTTVYGQSNDPIVGQSQNAEWCSADSRFPSLRAIRPHPNPHCVFTPLTD